MRADAQAETKDIPASVRREVLERDGGICRVCGSHVAEPALHHIVYRSEGGLHVPDNLVTVHWMYSPACHEIVHGRKRVWQPVLQEVVRHDGVNARQMLRWAHEWRKRNSLPEFRNALSDF